jgi:hypothetical protein
MAPVRKFTSTGLLETPCLQRPLSAVTPWIALVSCDANSTDASQIDDIFTLARDRGAVAGVSFSEIAARASFRSSIVDPAPLLQLFLCLHHQQGVCQP